MAAQVVSGDHVLALGKDALIIRALENAKAATTGLGTARFVAVKTIFGLTRAEARQLYIAYDFDPEELV